MASVDESRTSSSNQSGLRSSQLESRSSPSPIPETSLESQKSETTSLIESSSVQIEPQTSTDVMDNSHIGDALSIESKDTSSSSSNSLDKKHCWVCFVSEDEQEQEQEWVRPCHCRGTAQWVHQECLQRWIDEKQKMNASAKVVCSQCKAEYIIVVPPSGRLVYLIEWYDRFLYAASPFAAFTLVIGSVYWSAVSYGAVTTMQVLGIDDGKAFLETAEARTLLVGLPSIPVMLVLSKLIKWENQVLRLWYHCHQIPFFGRFFGKVDKAKITPRPSAQALLFQQDSFTDPLSGARLVCGALLLPTVASTFGRILYPDMPNIQRTLLGGLTFIIAKGALKIYLRQQQYLRHSQRKVIDAHQSRQQKSTQTTGSDTRTPPVNPAPREQRQEEAGERVPQGGWRWECTIN